MYRLLLLCFLISYFSSIYAQNPPPPIPPPPPGITGIYECDADQDGVAIYDLTTVNFFGLANPNDYYEPTYHQSQEDANLNVNPIADPYNYSNDLLLDYIWGRAEPKDVNSTPFIGEFFLDTYFLNFSYEIDEVVQCSQYHEPSCFNLLDPYVLFCDSGLNTTEFNFEFYNNSDDFNNRVNQITNPEFYTGVQWQETIFVRAESYLSGKVETTSFNIRTVAAPTVTADFEPLTELDENGDGIETFDLTLQNVTVVGEGYVSGALRFFLSEVDLMNEMNEITVPNQFTNTSNPQTIYVRADNYEYYPGCFETQYCYGYDSFQIVVEPCVDSDGDSICDSDDSCPNLDNALIGTSCDDGDPCTINDLYTEDCGCEGTFEDSDGDGVCDADDVCPGGNDTIDNDQNGIPDACQPTCVYRNDSFHNGSLTHTGQGSSSTEYVFPENSQDITFSISGLDSKLKGKPTNQYIEQVAISYVTGDDITRSFPLIDATQGQTISNISIPGVTKKITVTLTDSQDGNSGSSTMQVTLGDISYCVLEYPCLPDSDGDGICDDDDQCPDFDDNLIGTSCDDGDPCTTNDIYQADCGCAGVYTDADADGVCAGEDPDDSDACVPNPDSSNCQPCTYIIADDFESGFGNWIDGGNDVSLVNTNGNGGSASARLRDNSGINSSIYTNSLDLSGYNELSINFFFTSSGMGQGEGFFLELSQNGGSSYSILKRYVFQTDFINGQEIYETYNLPTPLSGASVLRIRCDGSSNKSLVYLDDIVITDCVASEFSHTSTSRIQLNVYETKIFPNPAKSILNIVGIGKTDNKVSIFNIVGQQVLEEKLNVNNSSTHQLDLSNLSSGIYMVMVSDSNDRLSHQFKLVVQK